ncbi:uncharacterized protein JCM15063_005884 [Sporobolomyces koalae]|uniref:uncharacterized protein n=1 Tax=Sporobolomyces koalae TaxID=500713 RepID=UPI00316D9866
MRIRLLLVATLSPLLAAASTSIVDVLSASPDHSLLLRAFQRARLIPTLNRLNGSTVFAPTDEAIRQAQERERSHDDDNVWSSLVLAEDDQEHDNLQLELRDTLLYHCLNYTLFPPPRSHSNGSDPDPEPEPPTSTLASVSKHLPLGVVTMQESLYFPMLSSYNHSFPQPPSLPGSEPDKPDPGAPTDHPEGLLRGHGQQVRVVRTSKREIAIGVDSTGQGGFKVEVDKIEYAKNGAFVPVQGVLEKPKDLASIVQTTPSLSTFASLLPDSLLSYLEQTSHLTLFAPTNEAWSELSDLEMRYLRSQFSEIDIGEIVGDAASRNATRSGNGGVGYLSQFGEDKLVMTLRNGTLAIETGEQDGIKVNGTKIEQGDILAKNGVLHTLPSLLLPSGSLALTAEKYLLALNCTKFVSLLHSVNMSHYVQIPSNQDTTIPPSPLPKLSSSSQHAFQSGASDREEGEGYTILALKDTLLTSTENLRLLTLPSFPSPGTPELEALLSYHILPGKLEPKSMHDGMLVGTELRPASLKRERQKLVVSVQDEEGGEGEGWQKSKSRREKEVVIGFGNANAIAEPVQVGNSIIYLISTILEPPASIISTAVSDLRLSTFIASVYSASLDKTFLSTPSITYLVPTNQAFETLGLGMSYLLLPTAQPELESLLRYHAIDELVYLEEFPDSGSNRYPTLERGSEIYLERGANSSLLAHGPTLEGSSANGEQRDAKVLEGDLLTETGVLHVVDQVEIPPSIEITVDKLMKGAKSTTMVELIKEANMSWILEGKPEPRPDDDDDDDELRFRNGDDEPRRAYTILCPTDKALSRLNLTYYLTHPVALSSLIRLHVIPTDALIEHANHGGEEEGTPLVLSDSITYPTLHSIERGGRSKYGKVAFKRWGSERGSWMVGIESARGTKGESDSARVVTWGRATPWIVTERSGTDSVVGNRNRRTRVARGGGVILIDSVLLPWEPGWFRKWGWIVLTAVVSTLVVALVVVWGIKKWRKRKGKLGEGYERVEGEED